VAKDLDRSQASIEVADLLCLAALAAEAEAELFGRHPRGSGRYAGRLLGRALCRVGSEMSRLRPVCAAQAGQWNEVPGRSARAG
jgi:hypothetical protein